MPPRCYSGVKCHLGVLGRQMPSGGIGASNATQNLLGRQKPPRGYWGVKGQSFQKILKKNSEKLFWASNATQVLFGRQMPPGGIGASNATRGYRGVKCHPGFTGASKATPRLLGRQRPGASKGPKASGRQKSGASKGPLWVKAIKATRRQISGSQNSCVRVHVVNGSGRQRR